MIIENLESIRYSDLFRRQVDVGKASAHDIARVVSVHKESYVVTKGHGEVFAELSGNLCNTANSSLDLPTTGDWVYANLYDDDSHAIIYGVLPRKTLLKRKSAGKSIDFQLIAANIDVAFIVQSVDDNLNLRRMERYLVMVNESDIDPVILLSKCDLISKDKLEEIVASISSVAPQTTTLGISNLNGDNIDTIKSILVPGQTYCLLGSSGVGKTTLLNSLLGNEQFETQAVRENDSRGRHTTTSRELIQLECGSLLIDTPGMRELGSISVDAGLEKTFSDLSELARYCKFGDCSHTREKGCAILAAVEQGKLAEERYQSFLKIKKESAFNDMSYYEKRKKDKDFGKLIKAVKKHKN
jgi:ribosome biogenesis GTPase